ncbi:hypothetical protein ZWY2020_042254 [Hordeum vulgare]|nr:hypothetical protein ZWY2020_042254 [Hordeum vulgare]
MCRPPLKEEQAVAHEVSEAVDGDLAETREAEAAEARAAEGDAAEGVTKDSVERVGADVELGEAPMVHCEGGERGVSEVAAAREVERAEAGGAKEGRGRRGGGCIGGARSRPRGWQRRLGRGAGGGARPRGTGRPQCEGGAEGRGGAVVVVRAARERQRGGE